MSKAGIKKSEKERVLDNEILDDLVDSLILWFTRHPSVQFQTLKSLLKLLADESLIELD
jgi:hypothetical protein